jgi:hypothetical protein
MHHPSLIVFALAAILLLSTVLLVARSAQGKPECAPRHPATGPAAPPPPRHPAPPPRRVPPQRTRAAAAHASPPGLGAPRHASPVLLLLHAGSFGDLCADSNAICPVKPSLDFY